VRFRRTLVGLKCDAANRREVRTGVFQTYPRGVEVDCGGSVCRGEHGFRRTLVGLKCSWQASGTTHPAVSDVPSWG